MKTQSERRGIERSGDEELAAKLRMISELCDVLRQGTDPWPVVEGAMSAVKSGRLDGQFVHSVVDQLAVGCPSLKTRLRG